MVSVIINCFNAETFISRALRSILDQTYLDFEIIIWDNFSNDNTVRIIKSYNDKRIKLFESKVHTNLGAARLEVIKKVKGEYIAFCDADDWWHPEKLSIQLSYLENTKFGFVWSDFIVVDFISNSRIQKHNYNQQKVLTYLSLLKSYDVGLLTLLVKSDCLDGLNPYLDINYDLISDFDFVMRISKKHKGLFIPKVLAYNSWHDLSLSLNKRDKGINEMLAWSSKKCNSSNYNPYEKLVGLKAQLQLSNNIFKFVSLVANEIKSFKLIFILLLNLFIKFSKKPLISIRLFINKLYSYLMNHMFIKWQFIYFWNNRMQLNAKYSNIKLPEGLIFAKYNCDDLNDQSIKNKMVNFFQFSELFNNKEFQCDQEIIIFAVIRGDDKSIIHATIVYPNSLFSPLSRLPFRSNLINDKVAYLSSGYTLPSYRLAPLSVITLAHFLPRLYEDYKIKGTLNLVHSSTPGAARYFEVIGFKKVFDFGQLSLINKIRYFLTKGSLQSYQSVTNIKSK